MTQAVDIMPSAPQPHDRATLPRWRWAVCKWKQFKNCFEGITVTKESKDDLRFGVADKAQEPQVCPHSADVKRQLPRSRD